MKHHNQLILPDTNTLIALFNNKEPASSTIEMALSEKTLLFSIICVAEFLVKATNKQITIMKKMTDVSGIIPVDQSIMKQAVQYRKQTLRKSKRIHLLDCFIAATAKIHKAILITSDKKDYPFHDITIKEPEDFNR